MLGILTCRASIGAKLVSGDWSIHRFEDDNVGMSCSSITPLNRASVWWVQCSVGVDVDQVDLTGDHQSILNGHVGLECP